MARMLTNSDLNRYYDEEVTLRRQDMKDSVAIAMPIINTILRHIHEQDPRFSAQPEMVGSYWQGLKVDKADEFDISVPLYKPPGMQWGTTPSNQRYYNFKDDGSKLPVFGAMANHGAIIAPWANPPGTSMRDDLKIVQTYNPLPPPPPGYFFLPFASESSDNIWNESEDLCFGGDLVPFLVKRRFKQLLVDAVTKLGLKESVHKSRKANGPAVTISVDVPGHHSISVDFAPLYQSHMLFPQFVNWPHPGAKWPSGDKIDAVKEVGINFVAKYEFYWLMSFAEAEKELVKEMDADGGCRKKCHRIMKKLLADLWCPTTKPVIKSYHLKNILFWECEKYPRSAEWDGEMLATRFYSMLLQLRNCIKERNLLQYFYKNINLLAGKNTTELDQVLSNIQNFLQNPKRYILQEG